MPADGTSQRNVVADSGQANGPSEAFYPPLGYQVVGDYVVGPDDVEDLDGRSDISDEGDLELNIEDLIRFDDEDDSDEDTSPHSSAIFMPPVHDSSDSRNLEEHFSRLSNVNITAFRRNADPSRASTETRSPFPDLSPGQLAMLSSPARGHKRKATNPPYHNELYKGVTPVQRRIINTTKRRKMTN